MDLQDRQSPNPAGVSKGTSQVSGHRIAKRLIDILGSATALCALSPVMAAVAFLIRVRMGRPIMFVQERAGLRGRPFTLYKFRTMRASASGELDVRTDSARLTSIGRLLRATSLDELPQLWNVLRGDLSLVGPRPLLMQYLARYSPEQARRHDVMPGITGWAQVNGRNAISWEEKFALDVWYVDNWSLLVDLRILALTLARVLRRDGIAQEGHVTMPEFMGHDAARREGHQS